MNDSLLGCATDLVRLATTIRSGLESAERTIPAINEHLADLATLGIVDFQIEGPTIYCRPAGVSSLHDDEFVIYQAALVMPGGIGAAIWGSTEYHEHISRPYGELVDLAPRFCWRSGILASGATPPPAGLSADMPWNAAATLMQSPVRTTRRAKALAKLMARVGEEFPLACPACGGDIRLRGDGRQEPAHAK